MQSAFEEGSLVCGRLWDPQMVTSVVLSCLTPVPVAMTSMSPASLVGSGGSR